MNTGGRVFLVVIAVPIAALLAYSARMRRVEIAAAPARSSAPVAPATQVARVTHASVQWQERLIGFPDYAAFVREATPAAEAGDADAQFALYTAFSNCERDDGERCAALRRQGEQPAKESARWLQRAVQANYPRALAENALLDIEAVRRAPRKPADAARRLSAARVQLARAL